MLSKAMTEDQDKLQELVAQVGGWGAAGAAAAAAVVVVAATLACAPSWR